MPYDARGIANLALDLAHELDLSLTHMAVHKVVFFAHGWYLATYRKPLVQQNFEAWEFGPVLKSVYSAFKNFGNSPITSRIEHFDLIEGKRQIIAANVGEDDVAFVRKIVEVYGPLHAFQLSQLTHRTGGAWDRVWNAPDGKISLGMRITNDMIIQDFLERRLDS